LDYASKQLKPKYKIGIISNVMAEYIHLILAKDDLELFDDVVLSYKAGVAKPDMEIYKLSLSNLGVKPQEAVFVDDQQRYVEAAEALGMQGVYFQNFGQMKSELEKLLAVDGSNH
jgi:epoxide hydrolase-like predicted phosphatase